MTGALIFLGIIALLAMACIALGAIAVAQEEYNKWLRAQVELSRLRDRSLPPRRMEIWLHKPKGSLRIVNLVTVDAGIVVEALALVGKGLRPFSEGGMAGVLTRDQLVALRNELFVLGLAHWHPSGKTQGVMFTDEGLAFLEACVEEQEARLRQAPRKLGVRTRAYHISGSNKAPQSVG